MLTHFTSAFAAVFLAGLPDKTMVASMVLSARYRRPWPVWVGVAGAYSVHVTVAVVLGALVRRLPERPVDLVVGLVFLTGAVLLWRGEGEPDGTPGGVHRAMPASPVRIAVASGSLVLLAEIGDLTQLATAGLTTRTGDPLAVWLGAWMALASAAALAVTVGRAVERRIRLGLVRRAASGLFALLGIVSLVSAAGG